MKTFKVQCVACSKGFEHSDRETAYEMARLHVNAEGHFSFRFVALEMYTIVFR